MQYNLFSGVKTLLENMRRNNTFISVDSLTYNNVSTFMVFKGQPDDLKNDLYYNMYIEFYRKNSIDNSIGPFKVNSNGFSIDELNDINIIIKKFFNVSKYANGSFSLSDFLKFINKNMSLTVVTPKNEAEKRLVSKSYSSDIDDEDKIYCFAIKKNREGYKRTEENTMKARILAPIIYKFLTSGGTKNSEDYSFCFSDKEIAQEEVIETFQKNMKKI